jgi:hypothetical protein
MSCGKSQHGFDNKLWSLAEMIRHFCFRTCDAYRNLDFAINLLIFSSRGIAMMDINGQRQTAKMAAEDILAEGDRIGWELTAHVRTKQFIADLDRLSTETILREMEGIKTSFHLTLQQTKFAYLSAPDSKYFENDRLFGDSVFQRFEEARQDIKDAGNCLASSLYTACVFHLMRVSEFGLRRLAAKLKVKIFDKGKRQQLEYGDWNKVIEGIHLRIATVRRLPAGPKKQEQLTRFAESGDHCTFMKDIWRNNVSHVRKPYSRDEALAAFGRVGDFMKFLASDLAGII